MGLGCGAPVSTLIPSGTTGVVDGRVVTAIGPGGSNLAKPGAAGTDRL